MSTLIEIEAAVGRLPLEQQEELLRHLAQTLHRRKGATEVSREQWMHRLDKLRAAIGTNDTADHALTTEQILTELREDRI